MKNENLQIVVVCCTKESEEGFKQTKLGQSLERFSFYPLMQKHIFYSNTEGLSKRYNEAIEAYKNEPTLLVFVHDDIEIVDHYWFQSVRIGLEHFALVGLAGNVRHMQGFTSWCCVDKNKTLDSTQNLSGLVAGLNSNGNIGWHVCCPAPAQCASLDGLFLAGVSTTFVKHEIKFDEQFTFHHYDTDISRQFINKGLPIGTWPISVVHHSVADMGCDWEKSADLYIAKWAEITKQQCDFDTILRIRANECLDIHEHFPTIRKLAAECGSVIEMGVRAGCSIWASAAGLKESVAENKLITYIDVQPCQNQAFEQVCEYHGIKTQWIHGSSLEISINLCDMLMIDTLHTYKQLSAELRRHHMQVNKYIVMHDTESPWGFKNEVNDHSEKDGLRPAIDDFLAEFSEQWELFKHYENNHGLTVLRRKI